MFFSPGNIRVLVEPVGFISYFFLQFPGGLAVADVVIAVRKASSPADAVFQQFTAAVVGKISYCGRKGGISGVPALNWTRQGIILVFMTGGHASISLFLIANGSHEVELGMVDRCCCEPCRWGR